MAEMKNLKIEVVRYNPEVDTAPHSAFYEVPYDATTSLLDALGYIKDNLAPDLSYRWSCRMAICVIFLPLIWSISTGPFQPSIVTFSVSRSAVAS